MLLEKQFRLLLYWTWIYYIDFSNYRLIYIESSLYQKDMMHNIFDNAHVTIKWFLNNFIHEMEMYVNCTKIITSRISTRK